MPASPDDPPALVLGPLLRYAGEREATVWVETDRPCTVGVLGHEEPTFWVAGHHYALVCVGGLEPATTTPYEVALDGTIRWPSPETEGPPSVIRTLDPEGPLHAVFGSCQVCVPHVPPYALTKDQDRRGREVDALLALTERLRGGTPTDLPDVLLLLGDQVYSDEISLGTRRRIEERERRGDPARADPPEGQIADFEEYTSLYHDAWGTPAMRWLLSTVSSAMIFDDHDVHDDWNISWTWVQQMRALPWWRERIIGAYMSYWIYQHLGNLSPAELEQDPVYAEVRGGREDAEPVLRRFAEEAAREIAGTRWSYRRDFGRTRLLVLDSRAGRVLDEQRREMLSEEGWAWVQESMDGERDHLLIATTLPWLLSPGLHHLEACSEAVCAGAWGRTAARLGEKVRQALDLEHWPAFHDSFVRLAELIHAVGSGARGPAPASIILLSGDVHHAYLAEASFPGLAPLRSAVIQAVCSPIRNPLDRRERRVLRAALSRPAAALARRMARSAGVAPEPVQWRFVDGPTFDNQVGFVTLDRCGARVAIEKTRPEDWAAPRLHRSLERTVA
ncbi:alkaline phosphatase family protein [Baekduia soli]|uniref:Alkaline phosphatase family protein n=1 Tax=Baekduia soli TaxID=496014 RepID=A0A5B8UCC0_9ACTN|nr:alkaline phosphatase D family protein [Baekduia soli]QEC50488.1 alkaline phosphatase family protein [Baekduia soli]